MSGKSISKGLFFKGYILSILLASLIALSIPAYGQASSSSKSASETKTDEVTVKAGETWEVSETTSLKSLTVEDGANVTAPDGCSLTMTVNGVETGQKLIDLKAADGATRIIPGTYKGRVVLIVAKANPTKSFKLRQALYLDEAGVVSDKSVIAAVVGKLPADGKINDIKISSTGECFNGIYVAGGSYSLNNVKINFTGDGRSDFEGYGSAIMATGKDTRLVVENSQIKNKGIVRTGVIADGGSKVIVKNSVINTQDGEKPPYVLPQRGGSGLGGSIGLCRATVVLGNNTQTSYINSTVSGTGWGLLASDMCKDIKIAAINSRISHTGDIGGYGAYAIGNATEWFLGSKLNVSCTGVTLKGGNLFYGDSTREAIAQLNSELDWGLTDKELKAIPVKNTIVNSKLFGIMCTSDNSTANVGGGTIFNTGNTVFLNKGKDLKITVDGSQGVQLNPGNGVIMQLMDDDDPGLSGGPYIEPTEPPVRDGGFDLTSTDGAAISGFSNITLKGDFYNSIGWGRNAAKPSAAGGPGAGAGGGTGGEMPGGSGSVIPGGVMAGGAPAGSTGGAPGGGGDMPGGAMPGSASSGPPKKNMVLNFDNAKITGIISSSEAHHSKPTIDYKDGVWVDYKMFGVVTNKVHEPVNNGVIVSLTNGTNWTVTSTSYLTSLTIDAGSTITAPKGYDVTMTVDGVAKPISPWKYTGKIVLTVNKSI